MTDNSPAQSPTRGRKRWYWLLTAICLAGILVAVFFRPARPAKPVPYRFVRRTQLNIFTLQPKFEVHDAGVIVYDDSLRYRKRDRAAVLFLVGWDGRERWWVPIPEPNNTGWPFPYLDICEYAVSADGHVVGTMVNDGPRLVVKTWRDGKRTSLVTIPCTPHGPLGAFLPVSLLALDDGRLLLYTTLDYLHQPWVSGSFDRRLLHLVAVEQDRIVATGTQVIGREISIERINRKDFAPDGSYLLLRRNQSEVEYSAINIDQGKVSLQVSYLSTNDRQLLLLRNGLLMSESGILYPAEKSILPLKGWKTRSTDLAGSWVLQQMSGEVIRILFPATGLSWQLTLPVAKQSFNDFSKESSVIVSANGRYVLCDDRQETGLGTSPLFTYRYYLYKYPGRRCAALPMINGAFEYRELRKVHPETRWFFLAPDGRVLSFFQYHDVFGTTDYECAVFDWK